LDFPILKTNNLELNEITLDDTDSIYEIFSNEDVVKYYDLEAFTEKQQSKLLINFYKSRFEKSSGIRWGIRLKNTNKCIGTCGFNSWSSPMKSATIGYDLNKGYWGQGLITEALRSIIKSGFSGELPCGILNRIQADTIPGNIASEKVLIKLGFKEEGLRRESGYWKNSFHDLKCYGLLKNEF